MGITNCGAHTIAPADVEGLYMLEKRPVSSALTDQQDGMAGRARYSGRHTPTH